MKHILDLEKLDSIVRSRSMNPYEVHSQISILYEDLTKTKFKPLEQGVDDVWSLLKGYSKVLKRSSKISGQGFNSISKVVKRVSANPSLETLNDETFELINKKSHQILTSINKTRQLISLVSPLTALKKSSDIFEKQRFKTLFFSGFMNFKINTYKCFIFLMVFMLTYFLSLLVTKEVESSAIVAALITSTIQALFINKIIDYKMNSYAWKHCQLYLERVRKDNRESEFIRKQFDALLKLTPKIRESIKNVEESLTNYSDAEKATFRYILFFRHLSKALCKKDTIVSLFSMTLYKIYSFQKSINTNGIFNVPIMDKYNYIF